MNEIYICLLFVTILPQESMQTISIECNTSKLAVIDGSASSLFVIGDRNNRFLTNPQEYDYFCSVQKSWVKDIRDYIRDCLPKFSTQKLMTRKLGNQIQIQANQLCDTQYTDANQLYNNTNCLNKVIDSLHNCMEDMIDYMSVVEDRVVGIERLTHLCCGYLYMRNCTRHMLNTKLKHSCHNSIEWFDSLLSGYSLRYFKQFCVTQEDCYQSICDSVQKFDKSLYKTNAKLRDKSILPAIIRIMLTTNV